ncbi:MAG: hypothetical protein U0169_25365 [Polyangiaceae bacterium]
MTRPVSKNAPTTKTSFTTAIRQAAIDKVDLLFAIDNSASMGDKQEYLKLAVPDLVSRLLNPYCVNDQGVPIVEGGRAVTTSDGNCARGKAEFQPVQDMHIGIVTSSLGPRTGDVCDPNDKTPTGLDSHQDDRGHLINRAGDNEAPIPSMNPSNFLAWFPSVTKNQNKKPPTGAQAIVQADALANSFRDLVSGVHQLGCGVESQLESWYRFLVQPDPYDTIGVSNNRAEWIGVDTTILKQRKDFLRPDSLVSVIVLTDENDSEIDVRSVGGNGYKFMSKQFKPPRGTSACDSDPNSSACTSCDLAGAAVKQNDSSCQKGPYAADNDWGYDMNLRHVHAKQKYGIDPQFPIERYLTGLTQRKVPDRQGEYPDPNAAYKGRHGQLHEPALRRSPPRRSDERGHALQPALGSVHPRPRLYGIIGGVPYQLLHFDPNVPGSAQLNDADWVKVLGQKSPAQVRLHGHRPAHGRVRSSRARTRSRHRSNPDPSTAANG